MEFDVVAELIETVAAAATDHPATSEYNPASVNFALSQLNDVAEMPELEVVGRAVAGLMGWEGRDRVTVRTGPSGEGSAPISSFGRMIVARARNRGAAEVLQELVDFVAVNTAPILEVAILWGLRPTAEVVLAEGVRLIPLDNLPPSHLRDYYLGISQTHVGGPDDTAAVKPRPRAALVRDWTYGPVFPQGPAPADGVHPSAVELAASAELLEDVARALTIGLRTPIFPLGHGYQADVTLPSMGMGGGSGGQAIHWAFQFETPEHALDAEAVQLLVARYLACEPKLRRSLRIAVDRLRTSQIHSWYHERVVDLGIALEAALLADTEQELAYRFTLRGTALLGGDDATRRTNAALLKHVYRLRSRVVHGGTTPHGVAAEEQAINDGTVVAYNVLDKLVDAQAFPDWDALVMGWD